MNRSAFAILALVFVAPAHADYDKTRWGMSPDQVEKLYPGGVSTPLDEPGETAYRVMRPITGFGTMLGLFAFGTDGLRRVDLFVTEPGSTVNLKKGLYQSRTTQDAATAAATLRGLLTEKYGAPKKSENENVFWVTKDGDFIGLMLAPSKKSGHTNVTVAFARLSDTSGQPGHGL